MKRFTTLFTLLVIIAGIFGSDRECSARLTEPDAVYFGTLTGGAAGSFLKLKLDSDSTTLATAVIAADLSYVLRVPMDAVEPRLAGTARSGDKVSFFLGEKMLRRTVIGERGSMVSLPLTATPSTKEDWDSLHPGDDGSGDMNRNGISDLQDFLDGNDAAACIWVDSNENSRETLVYHQLVLQNCLTAAQADGKHNLIKLAQGSYYGNFTYFAGPGEEYDLRIIGGYDPAGSGDRTSNDPAVTMLVGDVNKDEVRDGRVFDISAGTGKTVSTVRLEGLRIMYGGVTWTGAMDMKDPNGLQGGGVRIQSDLADLELVGNMFSDNFSYKGGAIQVKAVGPGKVFLANNVISNNAAFNNGAIHISQAGSGPVTLLNNSIVDNWVEDEGQGDSVLVASDSAPVDFTNNIIRGVYVVHSDTAIQSLGGGVFPLTVHNNNVMNSSDQVKALAIDLPGFVVDSSNITADPLYVKPQTGAYFYFPTDANYRLRQGSPCLDKGVDHPLLANIDAEGKPRLSGEKVDMGAFERPPVADAVYLNEIPLIDPIVHVEVVVDGFDHRGLVTNAANYTFKGRIESPVPVTGLSVTRRGVTTVLSLNPDNSFEYQLTLNEGKNWVPFDVTKVGGATVRIWYNVFKDTSPPTATVTTTAAASTRLSPIPFAVQFGSAVTGFTATDPIITNGSINATSFSGSSDSYSFTVIPITNGPVTVTIPAGVAGDAAGNANLASAPLTVVYDTVAPIVTLGSSLPGATYVSPIPVTVTFSEPVTGFNPAGLVVRNGVMSSVTGDSSGYSFTITPNGRDLLVTVDLPAGAVVDAAGNSSPAAIQLACHYAPPIEIMPNLPVTTLSRAGGYYNQSLTLTMSATDNAAIYYTLNGSAPTVSSTRYSGPILIDSTTTVRYFAMDVAGNSEQSQTATYVIDRELPVLTISSLADGRSANNATLNLAGVVTDNSGIKTVQVNGLQVTVNSNGSFTAPVSLVNGPNLITTSVVDLAGNEAGDSRTITLDLLAPALVVNSPADNSTSALADSQIVGSTEAGASITVKVNDLAAIPVTVNGSSFNTGVTLVAGLNTLEITAVDPAGNVTTVKRSVTYDNQQPTLAITVPAQDIRTNRSSVQIRGKVSDSLTAVTVTINDVVVSIASDGSFEKLVEFGAPGSYPVVVKAKDVAGNETIVQRNLIYDTTAPAFTINQVLTPTNEKSQTISGSREPGVVIAVSCPTATVSPVTYPTEDSWSVLLSGFVNGANLITVTATDNAGNNTVLTAEVLAGNIYSGAKTITINAPPGMTIFYTIDGTTPTTASNRYTGPVTITASCIFSYFAIDTLGNSSAITTAAYTIDTITPKLDVVTLASGATTTNRNLAISGTVSDNTRIQSLFINNIPVPFAADGSFTATRVLVPGSNVITTIATDIVGNSSSDTRTINLEAETVKPTLTVSTLADNAATNATPLNITGTVSDANGIDSLTINGTTVVVTNGAYSHALQLTEGANAIIIIATDNAGNQTTDSRTITFDRTLPTLTISAPADNSQTREASLTVSGTISKNGAVEISNTTTGTSLTAAVTGSSYSGIVQLAPGSNTIEVAVTDAAGNRSTAIKRTIMYDPDPPALAITVPPQDTQMQTLTTTIRGRVTDATETVVALTFDGVTSPLPVTDGAFELAITFPGEGFYSIVVTATDAAGNQQSRATRNLIYTLSPADTNGDGTTGLQEVLAALQHITGARTLTPTELLRLDCAPLGADGKPSPNGVVDTGDVILLLRRMVGLVSW